MTRANENHGLSNCVGSPLCIDCGGVCSTDDSDRRTYRPIQRPRDMPGYRWDVENARYVRDTALDSIVASVDFCGHDTAGPVF